MNIERPTSNGKKAHAKAQRRGGERERLMSNVEWEKGLTRRRDEQEDWRILGWSSTDYADGTGVICGYILAYADY